MPRKKRTYREYKAHGVKMAWLSWLLDRGVIYVAALVAGVFAVGMSLLPGVNALESMKRSDEKPSPYQDIKPVSSIAKTWASKLIAMKPTGFKAWKVDEASKPSSIPVPKGCALGDLPVSLVSTNTASYQGNDVAIQTYGAGQAAKNFNEMVSKVESCQRVEVARDESSVVVARYDGGFMILMGDAIIGGTTSDAKNRDALIGFYSTTGRKSLSDTKCVSINVSEDDSKRSFFYDPDSYEGLTNKKTMSTKVGAGDIPTFVEVKLDSIKNPYATEPESPLPADFPQLPKDEVSEPSAPSGVKTVDTFTKDAVFHIVDERGPGCGWEWSAQQAPDYDMNALAKEKADAIKAAQKAADKMANDYIDDKVRWTLGMTDFSMLAFDRNKYVESVNKVHAKWQWLDSEREKVYQPWLTYVANHDQWNTFDDRKQSASDQYDAALKQCQADQKELEDWENEWGEKYDQQQKAKQEEAKREQEEASKSVDPSTQPTDPSNTPSGSDPEQSPEASQSVQPSAPPRDPILDVRIPEKPSGCSQIPSRPAILDQEKPAEPMPPSIPAGVTIPDSWPQPANN